LKCIDQFPARGCVAVGSGKQDVAGGYFNEFKTGRFESVIPVCELELGLDYGINLRQTYVFARAAVVDQTYFSAGNASTHGDNNLSLFGVQFSLGVNY
jgi:hypothetical protein